MQIPTIAEAERAWNHAKDVLAAKRKEAARARMQSEIAEKCVELLKEEVDRAYQFVLQANLEASKAEARKVPGDEEEERQRKRVKQEQESL